MAAKEIILNNVECPSCGGKITEGSTCTECGWSGKHQESYSLELLKTGFMLKDRYEITEYLESKTGSTNCYLAMDKNTEHHVIVKEAGIPDNEEDIESKEYPEAEEDETQIEIICASEETKESEIKEVDEIID
jgi:ribosomal protein L32